MHETHVVPILPPCLPFRRQKKKRNEQETNGWQGNPSPWRRRPLATRYLYLLPCFRSGIPGQKVGKKKIKTLRSHFLPRTRAKRAYLAQKRKAENQRGGCISPSSDGPKPGETCFARKRTKGCLEKSWPALPCDPYSAHIPWCGSESCLSASRTVAPSWPIFPPRNQLPAAAFRQHPSSLGHPETSVGPDLREIGGLLLFHPRAPPTKRKGDVGTFFAGTTALAGPPVFSLYGSSFLLREPEVYESFYANGTGCERPVSVPTSLVVSPRTGRTQQRCVSAPL
mmetsp:Transcript_40080/g.103759  ORF Transcript_40080/g.103759 Transcript_40080/m.103759 type:complete len:282 (+) Transcript_40080:676-1521(+)